MACFVATSTSSLRHQSLGLDLPGARMTASMLDRQTLKALMAGLRIASICSTWLVT